MPKHNHTTSNTYQLHTAPEFTSYSDFLNYMTQLLSKNMNRREVKLMKALYEKGSSLNEIARIIDNEISDSQISKKIEELRRSQNTN